MGRPRLNLTGMRSGKLVAIQPVGMLDRNVLWLCQCDCGNTKVAIASKLTYKKKPLRSCGCLAYDLERNSRAKGPVEKRFWKFVYKTPCCWIWTGATSMGYGAIGDDRKKSGFSYAHRLSYEMHLHPIGDGRMVLHTCDVRSCVNPNHLYLGNHSDNIRDRYARQGQPHCCDHDKLLKRAVK